MRLPPKQEQRKKKVEAEVWEDKTAPWESESFISTSNITLTKSLDFHPNRPNTRLPHLTCTLLVPESPLWIMWFSAFDAHTHTRYVCKYTCIFEMIAEACFILYIIIDERESLCCTRHRKPHMSRKTQRKRYTQRPVASYLHLLCISASRTNSCQWFQGAFIQTPRHPLAKFNQEEAQKHTWK